MMRLGVNAALLAEPRMTGGISRHILGLLGALKALAQDCEVHLFSDRPLAPHPALEGCAVHLSDVRPRLLWEQASLPLEAAGARIDVLHSHLNYGLPRLAPGFSRVLTLHDLYTLRDIRSLTPLDPGWLSLNLSWRACASADAVITVSDYSKREILKEFPDWEDKIRVVHNGVESRFHPGAPDAEVLSRHGLSAPYALYVGSFGRRKNVALLAEGLKAMAGTLTLALAGGQVPAEIRAAFAGSAGVRWLGYVEDDDLPDLYRGAACAVIPSKEEGFGFQVLEAMASGCPALCSDSTSLPEVGGRAAAYFGAEDAKALGSLLDRAASDAPWRRGLVDAGLKRAEYFTWMKAAEKTLEVYRAILPTGRQT